jgi:hypothetical protein
VAERKSLGVVGAGFSGPVTAQSRPAATKVRRAPTFRAAGSRVDVQVAKQKPPQKVVTAATESRARVLSFAAASMRMT